MTDLRADLRDLLLLVDQHAAISREAAAAAGRLLVEMKAACNGAAEWRQRLAEIGVEPDRARTLMLAARSS